MLAEKSLSATGMRELFRGGTRGGRLGVAVRILLMGGL
jgi:hypothetical protein